MITTLADGRSEQFIVTPIDVRHGKTPITGDALERAYPQLFELYVRIYNQVAHGGRDDGLIFVGLIHSARSDDNNKARLIIPVS